MLKETRHGLKLATHVILLVCLSSASIAETTKEDPTLYFSVTREGLSTTGKWIPGDPTDKPAFPTETQIDCFRNSMECVEATADYSFGHPHVMLNYLQVAKWDDNSLIATSDSGVCMTNTLVISFADKGISETDGVKKLDPKLKESCKFFAADKTTRWDFVIKNSERWKKDEDAEWRLKPKN